MLLTSLKEPKSGALDSRRTAPRLFPSAPLRGWTLIITLGRPKANALRSLGCPKANALRSLGLEVKKLELKRLELKKLELKKLELQKLEVN